MYNTTRRISYYITKSMGEPARSERQLGELGLLPFRNALYLPDKLSGDLW